MPKLCFTNKTWKSSTSWPKTNCIFQNSWNQPKAHKSPRRVYSRKATAPW
jgi:hypothetical protein